MAAIEQSQAGMFSRLGLDSIRNRILLLALLATLIPALSTATLSYVRTRGALAETLEGELQGLGSQSARELDLWLKNRLYDLRVFVGSFEVTENLDRIGQEGPAATNALIRLTDYLIGVQSRAGDYTELSVLDAAGEPVASSGTLSTDVALPPDWLAALGRAETMLGEPYWDEALGKVAATLAVPIGSADGRFQGAMLATLTFDAVEEILTGLAPGEGGRIELIAQDGRIIAASTGVAGLGAALADETLTLLRDAAAETREYGDLGGVEMVGTLVGVEQLEWSVLTHLPSAEAYAPITRLRNATLLMVSFLLLVVGTVAYFIGLFIVRPLGVLTEGAAAVAGGDLSVDLPVTGKDEVGYLTEVFNLMVAQLRESKEELDAANATLVEQNVELERISMTDALTALFNRRYVMRALETEIARASRHERNVAVLMMDVDKFKQYNDSFGHQAGDEVLRGMGRVIQETTREPDVPARYGGEEFIVVLADCDLGGAVDAAERLRSRLAQEVFDGRNVTMSIGAAEFPTHGDTPATLIAAADAALYEAKHAGRDRVVAAGTSAAPKKKAPNKKAPSKKAESKTATEKPAAKKPSAKKTATKKTTTKKPAAKKTAAKKTATKKTAAKKKSG